MYIEVAVFTVLVEVVGEADLHLVGAGITVDAKLVNLIAVRVDCCGGNYRAVNGKFHVRPDILGDITPNITAWSEEADPLGDYLASLDRVLGLEVDLVLPGHRGVIEDCGGRIKEIRSHHQARLDEVLAALAVGSRTVYEVASELTWDIAAPTWDTFPVIQKWFAVGEAAAHLRHLEGLGAVRCEERGGRMLFSARH